MATQVAPVTFSFRDAKGWIGHLKHHIAWDDASPTFAADVISVYDALSLAIEGLTNCAFQGTSFWQQGTPPTLTYGTNAQYPAEWMKAVMTFSTAINQVISRFKIPAPKIAIMEADGITVINDGTSTPVVNYVNAVKVGVNSAHVATASGDPYTHFEGGIVKLGKQPRRFNGRVKSADLVAGEP